MSLVRDRMADLLRSAPRDAPAAAYAETVWGWDQLSAAAESLDKVLGEIGLGEGSRVGVILRNRPQHLALVAGIIATGRCITTLSSLQPPDRLARDIRASELPVVVAEADMLADPQVREAIAQYGRVVLISDDGSCTLEPGDPTAAARVEAEGVAIEMFTSGTTGEPKRVNLTYRQLDLSMGSASIRTKSGPNGEIVLSTGSSIISTPLVHIGGLWNSIAALYAGRLCVLLDRFTVQEWVDVVYRFKPRTAGLVPAAMKMILDANIPVEKLASLEASTSGTAFCPPELADEMLRRYGIRILMTYGATEFSGAVAGWNKKDHIAWWDRKKGAAGRPFPGVEMRVVDDNGQPLPLGASGTLEIKTRQAANGGADYIRTSDLAHLDEDGFLWIEGRADDAIIRGGFKVHPPVVKKVLEKHPSVREAAVAGVPHARLGAVPVAAVELVPGAPVPTTEDLLEIARAELTPYEVPVEIKIVDELPRTAAMKISKVELLELFTRAAVPVAGA